jgi:hypothetical protein
MFIFPIAQSMILFSIIVNVKSVLMGVPNESISRSTMIRFEIWIMVEQNGTSTWILSPNTMMILNSIDPEVSSVAEFSVCFPVNFFIVVIDVFKVPQFANWHQTNGGSFTVVVTNTGVGSLNKVQFFSGFSPIEIVVTPPVVKLFVSTVIIYNKI